MSLSSFDITATGIHKGRLVKDIALSGTWNRWKAREIKIPLFDDLYRIASSFYFLDRLFIRNAKNWDRDFHVSLCVSSPSFWMKSEVYELLTGILNFISGDHWDVKFIQRPFTPCFPGIETNFDDSKRVFCLYSGGLDSMAGLVYRLNESPEKSFIPVTVCHRTDMKVSISRQLFGIARHLANLEYKSHCLWPFGMRKEYDHFGSKRESTQRTRAFLFAAAGGISTMQCGASQLEVYEAGIGAINAPLQPEMSGTMTTRSSHPEFLRMMGELLSLISEKEFKIVLPFAEITKGELVSVLNNNPFLRKLAQSSFSCVCYPRRKGRKICGRCLACIFRRIALHQAGIKENLKDYEYDILNKSHWSRMSNEDRKPLCIFLEQIYELGVSTQQDRLPEWIEEHIISTNATMDRPMDSIIDLYRRYSIECSRFIEKAVEKKCPWAA